MIGTVISGSDRDVIEQRNPEATLYVSKLEPAVDEELLWELFTQVGPVVSVFLPKEAKSTQHKGFAFVEMRTEADAEYAMLVMNQTRLYGRPMAITRSDAGDPKTRFAPGAHLFIGGLDASVDEKVLHDTFSAFGALASNPSVGRDDAGHSRGFGFVSFDSFEAADRAIEAMNNMPLCGRPITVQYKFKAGSTERHGSAEERAFFAVRAPKVHFHPHTLFAAAPGAVVSTMPALPAAPLLGMGFGAGAPGVPEGLAAAAAALPVAGPGGVGTLGSATWAPAGGGGAAGRP